MNNNIYIVGALIILMLIGKLICNHLLQPPRSMVRYLKRYIRDSLEVSHFDTNLTQYTLPYREDQLGGGLYKNPICFGFKTKYSFPHHTLYEKLKRTSLRVPYLRVDQKLVKIQEGIDEFQIIEHTEKYRIEYHVIFSSKRVRGSGTSHCLVAVTVAFRIVSRNS